MEISLIGTAILGITDAVLHAPQWRFLTPAFKKEKTGSKRYKIAENARAMKPNTYSPSGLEYCRCRLKGEGGSGCTKRAPAFANDDHHLCRKPSDAAVSSWLIPVLSSYGGVQYFCGGRIGDREARYLLFGLRTAAGQRSGKWNFTFKKKLSILRRKKGDCRLGAGVFLEITPARQIFEKEPGCRQLRMECPTRTRSVLLVWMMRAPLCGIFSVRPGRWTGRRLSPAISGCG